MHSSALYIEKSIVSGLLEGTKRYADYFDSRVKITLILQREIRYIAKHTHITINKYYTMHFKTK